MTEEQEGALRERWRRLARRLPSGIGAIAERIAGRDLLLEASSLGFYGLVSALPLLTLAFSVAGAVGGEGTLDQVATWAEDNGPAGVGQLVEQLQSNSTLSWGAVLFTIWPATAYGGGLRRALQRATEHDESAPALRGRATAIGLVFALPILVLAGLPLITLLSSFGDEGVAGTVLGWTIALVAGITALATILTALFHAFSPARLDWKDTTRAAALTAAVTTVFSLGFVAYLQLGNVEERFGGGTIGLVVMLGVYLFVANALLLAGFEAAVHLDEETAGDTGGDAAHRSAEEKS